MKLFRSLLLSLLLLANAALANTFTTDFTDLWWNERESGWGVTATHQGDVVFLTFFIYSTDNKAQWYTGQATYASQNAQGAVVFTGPMYSVTGPWFGTTFNPLAVGVRQVGTVTFTAFVDAATLIYSIDGVVVSKSVTRQTFRNNDLTGQYAGVSKTTSFGCSNPASNGVSSIDDGDFTITTTSTTFRMNTTTGNPCNLVGSYTQTGRMGKAQGTYSCAGGVSGTFQYLEIEATTGSISYRSTLSNGNCTRIEGQVVAVKK